MPTDIAGAWDDGARITRAPNALGDHVSDQLRAYVETVRRSSANTDETQQPNCTQRNGDHESADRPRRLGRVADVQTRSGHAQRPVGVAEGPRGARDNGADPRAGHARRAQRQKRGIRRAMARMAGVQVAYTLLCFAIGVAACYFILSRTNVVFDNRAAVIIHSQVVNTPVLESDRRLVYTAYYTRRSDCSVPIGWYEIVGKTFSGSQFALPKVQPRTYGTWEAGKNKTVQSVVIIPDVVPAGNYKTRWHYAYDCHRAMRRQWVISPWMPFTIK